MNTALLIIDIQNDYFPGGAMPLAGAMEAGRCASRVLAAFRERSLPVVHVQHISMRAGATFFLPGTEGAKIHASLQPAAGETVIEKHFPSAFRETGLAAHLQALGIGRLAIVGMMTHMCVDTTVRAAADLGFACVLAHDACATKALAFGGVTVAPADVHAAFIAALNGAFAKAVTAEELIALL